MNLLKTIVLFLFFTSLSFSQSKIANDTLLASQYFKKADSLLTDRKLDSSIVYFKKALPIYEKAQAWERVAGCYNKISENERRKSEFQESLNNAEMAMKICIKHLAEKNEEKSITYSNIGSAYYKMSDFQNALVNFQKSLEIKKQIFSGDHKFLSTSFGDLGLVYNAISQYDKAKEYQQKSLDMDIRLFGEEDQRVGNDLYNLAGTLSDLGEHSQALSYYRKSLEITIKNKGQEHLSVGYDYSGLGSYYSGLKQYQNALKYQLKALEIFRKNESQYPLFAIYINIGLTLTDIGEYSKALQYHKKGMDIGLKILDKNHPSIGICYWNIGFVHEKKEEKDLSIDYYSKALRIYKKAFGNNHPDIADLYINLGNVYIAKRDFKKALRYHTDALNIYSQTFKKENFKIATSLLSLSMLHFEQNNLTESFDYSQKAIRIVDSLYGELSPLSVEFLFQIGVIYYKQKDYQNALLFFDKALASNYNSNFDSLAGVFNPSQYHNSKMLFQTLEEKAKTFVKKYKKEKKIEDLNGGIEVYQNINSLIEYTRKSYQRHEDKLFFAKQAKGIYANAIKAELLLQEATKEENNNISIPYSYIEKSKSNTLKDLLNDSNAKNYIGLPSKLNEVEKNLRVNKAFYQSKINEEFSKKERDSVKITSYESELFNISRKQDSLTKVLEKNYPKYHQLKYKNEVISVADVQEKLDDKKTLLEFFTADSITYAFTISKSKIAVMELSTPKLDEQIEQFRSSITKNYDAYKEISYRLYQTLVAPIKQELVGNQLIIVPDGSLWHLNFDLLLTEENASNNPKTGPYFLKEYAISYANSATLLFGDQQEQIISKEQQECLAFSFSSGDTISTTRNVSLKAFRNLGMDLPGTREEIKAIANIVDGQYFYGSEATEQNFKEHAGAYNILHLALHGDVDNERPENSRLYFTKSKDTIEDNYLYSHELFALDIPAELTVLSACNTGTGKIAKGEGIMSLGNAFQYAGTKSLLLTNWEVSDETTPKIMEYFYTNLKEGKNKAEALQQAKLQFLTTTNEETYHPYYWGGFYLLGDTTAIQFQDNNYIYWWVGIGILALILLSLFWYRKRVLN
ncbi:CHAT domain-containing protein [Aquimarina sp. BL5]|uniref:CHAT domain-containing protein n=1 Tax=Aquimarina sp. BL5 TaxID=1714860 RepID=UPI000E46D3D8|nr:CHAT domain-containing tetratricopeptide repeat protein [Aquimarina sp. BL5]AXT52206.1 CHAT domain-containing protein [Aquimarina sp. BL5]RKN07683.1 CHAT domain-containing protein [Aquimarina sp. BL5]